MFKRSGVLFSLCAVLLACGQANTYDDTPVDAGSDVITNTDTGKDAHWKKPETGPACEQDDSKDFRLTPDQIMYGGGKVMTEGANVYFIWYGDWKGSPTPAIIEELTKNIGNSPWYAINKTYYQENNVLVGGVDEQQLVAKVRVPASTRVTFTKSVYVSPTRGNNLSDRDVLDVVTDQLEAKVLPLDINGVYFVMTSKGIGQTDGWYSFCAQYCGWHFHSIVKVGDDSVPIKYSFVGDPTDCLDSCTIHNWSSDLGVEVSPNGDWAADGMASVYAHELAEAVTDPYIDAWLDIMGMQNADKCAWTFGKMYCTPNGAIANVKIGARDYLIQRNWVNDEKGGRCDMRP